MFGTALSRDVKLKDDSQQSEKLPQDTPPKKGKPKRGPPEDNHEDDEVAFAIPLTKKAKLIVGGEGVDWSQVEVDLLKQLVEQQGKKAYPCWNDIAANFPDRTHIECLSKWQSLSCPPVIKERRGSWTTEEDSILLEKLQLYGREWAEIAAHLPGRQGEQCRARFIYQLDPQLKERGKWNKEEDNILLEKHELHGEQWTEIAAFLPGRQGEQCRARVNNLVNNHVDRQLKKGEWTDDEEATLIALHRHHGNRWVDIAKQLPGRSDNDVKHHWYAQFQEYGKEKLVGAAIQQVQLMQNVESVPNQQQAPPPGSWPTGPSKSSNCSTSTEAVCGPGGLLCFSKSDVAFWRSIELEFGGVSSSFDVSRFTKLEGVSLEEDEVPTGLLHQCIALEELGNHEDYVGSVESCDDNSRLMELKDDSLEEEESGWKLMDGDVFRFPRNSAIFCTAVGTGNQLIVVTFFHWCLALTGLISTTNRGLVLTGVVVLYSLTGIISCFMAVRLYQQMSGNNWAQCLALLATLFPFPVVSVLMWVNHVALANGSTSALPFTRILTMNALYLFLCFALTTRLTGERPTEIPWYRGRISQVLIAVFLHFSAIYIEVHYTSLPQGPLPISSCLEVLDSISV